MTPGLLTDLNSRTIWPPGVPNVSVCLKAQDSHLRPERTCSCGMWGVNELEDLISYTSGLAAYGKTAFWGKIIRHEKGIRAEKAYPMEIIVVNAKSSQTPLPTLLKMLGDLYQVPVYVDHEFVFRIQNRIVEKRKREEEERERRKLEEEAQRRAEEEKRQAEIAAQRAAWFKESQKAHAERLVRERAERERCEAQRKIARRDKSRLKRALLKEFRKSVEGENE